jgi:ABC-type uncharacterized transport system ATPase subunit
MADFLQLKGITKVYGNGVVANNQADFSLRRGEIHAIAGENGAGKSTIMKILYGLERMDAGEISLDGEPLAIRSVQDAADHGIGMVQQHFMLVNELPVYENVFLGIEKARNGILDAQGMREEVRRLGEKYDMPVDPQALCGSLPVGAAQKVEILKVLARGAKILILDEPTAVLTPQETKQLFKQLRLLKEDQCSIIIITHKLKEIKEICDRVTIMRAGKSCGVFDVAGITEADLSRLMVGSDVNLSVEKPPVQPGKVVLEVNHLTIAKKNGAPAARDISFSLREGEILCLAGVEGNGQQETIQAITGLRKADAGEIALLGTPIGKRSVKQIRDLGLAHIPEDRMRTGTNKEASIFDNLIAVRAAGEQKGFFLPIKKWKEWAREQISAYCVKADGIQTRIGQLSGGNMQKVVVAREMETDPKLLICDQPTRGIDVGAIEFIHRKIVAMREAGAAILLLSADLSEVFDLADRILVFHNGEITAHITDVPGTSEEQLGKYMLGIEKMDLNTVCEKEGTT